MAHADEGEPPAGVPLPDLSYLWDGGAAPFIWAALGTRLALDTFAKPRSTPLMFSSEEGGAPSSSWQVPGWAVSATAGVLATAMLGSGSGSRWYHVKGLAQSLSTGVALTAGIKVVFGRHRPDWDKGTNADSDRRSFPSGHATQAFAIATYAVFYLRNHVFDSQRSGGGFPIYELATYAALYGAAGAVAAERVIHNQHHLSDVAVGAALGSVTSFLFFRFQDRRYRDHAAGERGPVLTPTIGRDGAGAAMSWTW